MKYRRRIYYSAAERAEIWDLWQRGESMSSIGRAFDRQSYYVFQSSLQLAVSVRQIEGIQSRLFC